MYKSELAHRHRTLYGPPLWVAEKLAESLTQLHDAGIGPFRHLHADPEWREIPLAPQPADVHQIRWENGGAHGLDGGSFLGFALEQPVFVYGIRLRCSYNGAPAEHVLQGLWRNSYSNEFSDAERHSVETIEAGEDEVLATIWVNDTINQFRIHPDTKPFGFRLAEIVVLARPIGQPIALDLPVPVYHLRARIDLARASSDAYLGGYWHGTEDWGRWSGAESSVRFRLEQAQPLRLRMMANTFGEQKVLVNFNGRDLNPLRGSAEAGLIELDLPADAVAQTNILTFTLPEARSPKSVGASKDDRVLGLGVAWIEFLPSVREDEKVP